MNNTNVISDNTLLKLALPLYKVVVRKECASIIGISKRTQDYRIGQLINHSVFNTIKPTFTIIDLLDPAIEDPEDLYNIFEPKEKNISVYFLLGSDVLLAEKRSLLTYLNQVNKKHPNLVLIFSFRKNITYPWNIKKLSVYNSLYQNVLIHPQYSNEDVEHFIRYLEKKFFIQIPGNISKKIARLCKPNLWLIKEAVRQYAKYQSSSNIFDHEEIKLKLKIIYNEFESEEIEAIKKMVKKSGIYTEQEKSIIRYLNRSNSLSPLLLQYITDESSRNQVISINSERKILLNSVMIDSMFSKSEKKGLRYLLTKPNTLVKRNDLAEVIWDKNKTYTDWALDQFVKRLRKRFTQLGLAKNIFRTVKNQGFILFSE